VADLTDIEDVAGGIVGYGFYQRMVDRYGQLNVLFYGALIIFLGIGFIVFMFHGLVNQDSKLTWNKVKPNMKLYAGDDFFNDTTLDRVSLFRLLKPITAADIDTMKIEDWQKLKLKEQIDTTLKPQLVHDAIVLQVDSMFKRKTSYIGKFIRRDSSIEYIFTDRWYIIKPNFTVSNCCYRDSVPKGYIYASKDYYVPASDVRLEEAAPFRNKR